MVKESTVTLNAEQQLFIIHCGNGYSCLGFDVCFERSKRLAAELGVGVPLSAYIGTLQGYAYYGELIELARRKHNETGWRSESELTHELIGKEGMRVEAVDQWGQTKRFWVGKSTGFIPCHLEVKQRNSSGGVAALGPYKSVRIIARSKY